MTVEIMTVISVISIGFGIWGTVKAAGRNKSIDDKATASEITTVIVKLENIAKELMEIKGEFRAEIQTIKDISQKNHDDIIRIDTSLKSAWNAINELKGNYKKVVEDDGK